jgi:catechol 2,3-dioxygenase-like lactoylglutathione lyase family enzyme
MPISQVKEVALYVKNLERTKAFYADLLGFPLIGMVESRHIFFRAGNSVLLCFIAESTQNDTILPPHFGYGQQHIAFEVPAHEYEDWKQKITDLGIVIIHEHTWREGVKSFYFKDYDEHILEIIPAMMWGF